MRKIEVKILAPDINLSTLLNDHLVPWVRRQESCGMDQSLLAFLVGWVRRFQHSTGQVYKGNQQLEVAVQCG